MVLLSVLPVGLLQTWAAVEHGYWYARSEAFLQSPLMDTLRWLRVIGDTIFALGAVTFVVAVGVITIGRRPRAASSPRRRRAGGAAQGDRALAARRSSARAVVVARWRGMGAVPPRPAQRRGHFAGSPRCGSTASTTM